jgi:beta-galactosidase/beta-glucuronidase
LKKNIVFLSMVSFIFGCSHPQILRQEISLNGNWKIAKTESVTQFPTDFQSEIAVPGLVDMATPKIDAQDTAYINNVYWYKRSFKLENTDSEVIQLKINKAAYHTRVFLNGKFVGENVYSFTPSLFNLKPFLNKENELLIAVGCRNNLPDTVTHGGDFEKMKYTPGIYDDVKLIVSGNPFIANVQTVPNIKTGELRVVAEIQSEIATENPKVSYAVREAVSKKVVAEGAVDQERYQHSKIDFTLKIPDCKLWSPENPFLYELEVSTSEDNITTRFGMRSFEASKDSGVFLLNAKPYFLGGTNVCIYRFFEDPNRANLPWDTKWATLLHAQFKKMNWNSIRYCIGFPPEKWYEIADSLGLLIQDEYPIWTGGKGGFEKLMGKISAKQIAAEYGIWMRERWNHPCVVIWDAQNESVNDTTGRSIQMVRNLDLTNRPWDNGWASPVRETDVIESHPYLFSNYFEGEKPSPVGYMKDFFSTVRLPNNDPNDHCPKPNGERYSNPVINNEYSWLWLNRDGTTTTLTDRVYQVAFPEAITKEQKFEACAKNTAMLTEYWRAHGKCAGVLHFCGLGYSRSGKPRGQTSDNFIDLKNLVYESYFFKYVKPAFSRVGLMTEFWEKSVKSKQKIVVPVHLMNDTYEVFSDSVKLVVWKDQQAISMQSLAVDVNGLKKRIVEFSISAPAEKGKYRMEAVIKYNNEPVFSTREFSVN